MTIVGFLVEKQFFHKQRLECFEYCSDADYLLDNLHEEYIVILFL